MEDWYRDLVGIEQREQLLLHDYAPHEEYLRSLSGGVIDIGGGAGIAARFLRPDVRYIVVDPSEVWETTEWANFGRHFRGSGPQPDFVKASGEMLPFPDGQFDVALSFWSLNHVADPRACLAEMARVLKRGGRARLVIDDIEPSWSDLLTDGAARAWGRIASNGYTAKIQRSLMEAVRLKIRGTWPVHEDHIAIAEPDLLRWFGDSFTLFNRQWLGGSLIFDLMKR